MAIRASQSNVSAALKEDMPEMEIEPRLEITLVHARKRNQPHAAADVVTDEMGHQSADHIDDNADRDRLAGVKVRRCHHSRNLAPCSRQVLRRWQCVSKIGQGTAALTRAFIARYHRAHGMT